MFELLGEDKYREKYVQSMRAKHLNFIQIFFIRNQVKPPRVSRNTKCF